MKKRATPLVLDADTPKRVEHITLSLSVEALHRKATRKTLDVAPHFQRKFVWDTAKCVRLIESILLNYPVPAIYLAETEDGKEEVVDGQQRLTAIFNFINGEYRLRRPYLAVLADEVGGKSFAELEDEQRDRISDYNISIIKVPHTAPATLKIDLFRRLNIGIAKLNAQELRNCLYRGDYNDCIRRLATYDSYRSATGFSAHSIKRMKPEEYVLMFCLFYSLPLERYKKSLTQHLDDEIARQPAPREFEEIERQFKKSADLARSIWGEHAFRIYSFDEAAREGKWSRQLNQGLYQIVMAGFVPYEKRDVQPVADLVREELLNLQLYNAVFRDSLTGAGTNSPAKIRQKFRIWKSTLERVLKYPTSEPRAFSGALKRSLWEAHPTCGLCKQQVMSVDDAEVDHIRSWSEGGKTVPENAQITHRFCNRSRGAREVQYVSDATVRDEDPEHPENGSADSHMRADGLRVATLERTTSRKARHNLPAGREAKTYTEILVERLGISTRNATYSGKRRYVRIPLGKTDVRLAFRSRSDRYGIGVFARNSGGKDRIREDQLQLISLGLAEHIPGGTRTDPPLEFYKSFPINGTSDAQMQKLISAIEELFGANAARM